ncbi:hypothetical protein IMSHALPRED_007677 [Imshaugia aleurites]|uniref:Amidohydrolase-related domain-containing protein n=1 Tax=Imshaugia aleurites TaxID=172621 RepID=A0A8H3FPQ8_9LECA|nr:hypothetical protein IMSHALPRED_007677 [Imshaugia aleurites]
MESYDLLVVNGLVVTASDIGHYDIAIKGEKIALLAPKGSLTEIAAKRVIDAEGGYVMPGGVDAHVHLDEPQLFGKGKSADDYETGTRSAICGGTTTVITFAPQSKGNTSLFSALQRTHVKAHQNCYTDYSFHLLISSPTPNVLSEFSALREQGISSLKIYMTYEALQLRDDQILDVLLEARRNGITTLIHAENGDILAWMTEQLEARGLYAPKYHATSRPQIVEAEATNRAIALSSIIDTSILIVHVSSPSAAANIRHAQTKGLPIWAETCPQYLLLTRSDLDKPGFEGAKCVCSPPPREGSKDHEAIWRGLANGTFTILSSDHCPFVYNDGERGKKSVLSEEFPEGRFRYIPNGCPGVETRLPLVLCEGKKRLGLSKFVEVTSTNAAKLYGLYPKKGALLAGLSDADLCIWYPEGTLKGLTIKNGQLHHNVDYTPYEGREVGNWPRWTILRGKVQWARDEGGVVGEKGFGEFVMRGASRMAGGERKGDWEVSAF